MVHKEDTNANQVKYQIDAIADANRFIKGFVEGSDSICLVSNFAQILRFCQPSLAHLTLT
jgi:hypothetical protein